MDSLYIIIPAYNEAENIASTIEEWYDVIEEHSGDGRSRLVIIDDGSSDSTLEIIEKEKESKPQLEVITKENGGHGSSIYQGYLYAISKGADYIFQTDSDGQTLASEFEQFYGARKEYEFQIGDRVSREDGFTRRVVSFCVRCAVLLTFGTRERDVNTPYRLIGRDALATALQYIPENFNLTNVAMTGIFGCMSKGKCKGQKEIRMRFVPISFRPRQGGKNSINLFKIVKIGMRALRELRSIRHNLGK